MYYRGAKAAVLVFDLGNETSLQHSITWLKDLKQHADPDVVVCLAGNKCDKPSEVDPRKIEEIARSMEAKFVKCSALTGEGVDAVFSTLAQGILSNYKGKLGRASEKQLNLSDKLSKDNDDGSGSLCC
jgi:small GTP-binding protein